mgnify:CR=1 FL=1
MTKTNFAYMIFDQAGHDGPSLANDWESYKRTGAPVYVGQTVEEAAAPGCCGRWWRGGRRWWCDCGLVPVQVDVDAAIAAAGALVERDLVAALVERDLRQRDARCG